MELPEDRPAVAIRLIGTDGLVESGYGVHIDDEHAEEEDFLPNARVSCCRSRPASTTRNGGPLSSCSIGIDSKLGCSEPASSLLLKRNSADFLKKLILILFG